jgi:hypothetical protein
MRIIPIVVLLCLIIGGCSTVKPIGTYYCEDGKRVTYVMGVGKDFHITGVSTLMVLDRYMWDPAKNETMLIRSDTNGSDNANQSPMNALKSLPMIPF